MPKSKHFYKFCSILIILLLLCILSFIFIFIIFKDLTILVSFFYDYIDSGKSIFIPLLPKINIIFFIPGADQITKFTYGHLIDIILLINITTWLESSFYHYFIKKFMYNGVDLIYMELELNALQFNKIYSPHDTDLYFNLEDLPEYYLSDEILLKLLVLQNKYLINKLKFRMRFWNFLINNHLFLYFRLSFEGFLMYHSKFYNILIKSTYPDSFNHIITEGIDMINLCLNKMLKKSNSTLE